MTTQPATPPVSFEPFWHAVVSQRAPIIDKAIRRADAAEDYAQKCRDGYDHAIDLDVKALYTAEQMEAYRAATLEECRAKCEAIANEYARTEGRRYPELKSDAETGASACEAAIRALSNP